MSQVGSAFVAVLLVYCLYQLCRGAALRTSLLGERRISYREGFLIRLWGESVRQLTFTGPFLAEPAKAWLLRGRPGITSHQAFAGTLAEYLSYTLCSAGLSVAALHYLRSRYELTGAAGTTALVVLVVMALFLAGSAVAIFFRIHLIGSILAAFTRLPPLRSRLRVNLQEVHRTEDLLLEVFHARPARFLALLALELLAQGFLVLELWLLLRAVEISFPWAHPLLIEGAIKFVSLAFFFVPTQMGASEAVYAVVFEALGYAAATGFAISFLRRLRNLAGAGAGLAAMALLGRRGREDSGIPP